MSSIYKITYPNGKIYIGRDLADSINYFGSASSDLIAQDFTPEERKDFMIRKEILWQSATATDTEVNAKKAEFIRSYRSNDPEVGYNRWPQAPQPGRIPPVEKHRVLFVRRSQTDLAGAERRA